MKSSLMFAATIAVSALAFAQSNGNGNGSPNGNAYGKVTRLVGEAIPPGSAGTGAILLNYNGGPVMLGQTHIYYIYYGNWSGDANGKTILANFANNLNGSNYYNILTQYGNGSQNISNSVVLGGVTTSTYTASNPSLLTFNDIFAIVQTAIGNGSLPLDPNGLYFVLTAVGVGQTNGTNGSFLTQYCGWHTAGTYNGQWVKFSFVGDAGNSSGCSVQFGGSPNGDPPVDAMISVIAHELSEAVTDPLINAWLDANGQEIGDKCAWNFGTTFAAPNGSTANVVLGGFDFLIQQEFSNADDACVMTYTASPNFTIAVSPSSQTANQGTTTGNYTVTVTPTNGFGGTVGLSLSGNPSGSTPGAFSVNPTASTSTFNVNTGTASPGNYTLTVTGTSGSLTHTATASLVIPQADFSMSVTPSSQTVTQGGTSGSYTINVTPLNGFTGTPAFTFSAASGITFTPSGNTFTATAGSTVAAGTYTITVTGTSGSLTHTATASLVVNPIGTFTVSVAPSTVTVKRKGSGKYTVTVTSAGGFNSKVNLTVSGLPNHATGSFSPTSVTGSGASTLTINAAANTPTGTSNITVTGTSGTLTSSQNVHLTIN